MSETALTATALLGVLAAIAFPAAWVAFALAAIILLALGSRVLGEVREDLDLDGGEDQ